MSFFENLVEFIEKSAVGDPVFGLIGEVNQDKSLWKREAGALHCQELKWQLWPLWPMIKFIANWINTDRTASLQDNKLFGVLVVDRHTNKEVVINLEPNLSDKEWHLFERRLFKLRMSGTWGKPCQKGRISLCSLHRTGVGHPRTNRDLSTRRVKKANVNFIRYGDDKFDQQMKQILDKLPSKKSSVWKEMSDEDRRALAKLENTSCLKDGHYEVGMLWRSNYTVNRQERYGWS